MDQNRFDVLKATCPSRSVLARVVSKWAVLVVVALDEEPMRFTRLQEVIEGVSAKVLVSTLRGLERDGVIWRRDYGGMPPHVEYGLTSLGESLSQPLSVLQDWAQNHAQEVLDARRAFDGEAGLESAALNS